ncbi:hypothetical protein CF319_g5809 [Tilletia indica]|nr:hypothetical protein CF319_g5809 [Tilletia indica]
MPDAIDALAAYLTEIDEKANRSEQEPTGSILPASIHLLSAHRCDDEEIDTTITRYTRDFPRGTYWQGHLVSLSTQLQAYFSSDKQVFYQYDRCLPTDLVGVKLFDHLRAPRVTIQSIDEFRRSFDVFGGSVLKNLDWANVGVAGGCVLACLTQGHFDRELINSDIDLFLWGLDAAGMERKVQQIKATIEANVLRFSAKYVIERSAGAVTFIPHRRSDGRKIQVVLRAYHNPAAVLSNFDIDPACVFFDGEDVWLSLRAVRALYTGYTTTSGAISSSFAARIIKYATRGYGILVRPDEDEADKSILLRNMDTLLRKEESAVAAYFTRLPWTGKKNFKKVFTAMKSSAPNNWTHSYSALASLAALWHLAHMTGRIDELMDEVGAASHIYGLYEGSDAMMGRIGPEQWLGVLEIISPSLKQRKWTITDHMWKVQDADVTKKTLALVVILPLLLRQRLQAMDGFTNLARMRNTDDVEDAGGNQLEICLWALTGDEVWQPLQGQRSVVHQLLVTAAMVTAWTVWKVSSGAPWPTMHYGRSLHNAQLYSYSAALTQVGDFCVWIRE